MNASNCSTNECIFCNYEFDPKGHVLIENEHCQYIQLKDEVLIGAGIIIPKFHRETVFDLSPEEWTATYDLLQQVKRMMDEKYAPQGYNVGWNVGTVGGQEVFHAHLHVIPRYADEPYAGRGIRYWIKQKENKRNRTNEQVVQDAGVIDGE